MKSNIFTVAGVVALLLACSFGVGSCVVTGCGPSYSQGERVGHVRKLSEKGVVFKSYEGDLAMAVPGQMTVDDWYFSTRDPVVVAKLEAAIKSGARVSLHYRQWFFRPISICTDSEIVDVEILSPTTQP